MKKFWDFLTRKPKSFAEWCLCVFLTVITILLWNMAMSLLFSLLGINADPNSPGIDELIKKHPALTFIIAISLGPMIEEFLYRFLPLMTVKLIGRLFKKYSGILMAIAVIASSILFGYAHNGWISIPFQGVAGLFYGLLFLKCLKGAKGFKAAAIAYITVVCAHGLNNFIAFSSMFF